MMKFYSTVVDGFIKGEFSGIRMSMETALFKEFLNGNVVICTRPALMHQGEDFEPETIATDGMLYSKSDMVKYCRQYDSLSSEGELLFSHHVYDFNSFLRLFRLDDICLKEDKAILYFVDKNLPTTRITDLNWTSELVNGYLCDSKFYALELAENGLFKEWCLSK